MYEIRGVINYAWQRAAAGATTEASTGYGDLYLARMPARRLDRRRGRDLFTPLLSVPGGHLIDGGLRHLESFGDVRAGFSGLPVQVGFRDLPLAFFRETCPPRAALSFPLLRSSLCLRLLGALDGRQDGCRQLPVDHGRVPLSEVLNPGLRPRPRQCL